MQEKSLKTIYSYKQLCFLQNITYFWYKKLQFHQFPFQPNYFLFFEKSRILTFAFNPFIRCRSDDTQTGCSEHYQRSHCLTPQSQQYKTQTEISFYKLFSKSKKRPFRIVKSKVKESFPQHIYLQYVGKVKRRGISVPANLENLENIVCKDYCKD